MEIIVEITFLNNEVQEVNARKLLNWRRKEADRIVDEKYVGEDKIVVREFVVEMGDYTERDIAEFEKEHKILNKPRKPRRYA